MFSVQDIIRVIGISYQGKPHHLPCAPVMLSELLRPPHTVRPILGTEGTPDTRPCHVCNEPLQKPKPLPRVRPID